VALALGEEGVVLGAGDLVFTGAFVGVGFLVAVGVWPAG
jgi:hypothetical protein